MSAYVLSLVALVSLQALTSDSSRTLMWDSSRTLTWDSSRTLTFDDFYRAVASNHPVVRQARLLEDIADAEVQGARGGFDPSLSAGWNRKTFQGTRYYDYVDAALTIPTPLGVDVKVGYERASGAFITPDRRTPRGGLLTAGVVVPIGQRLITDERRTALSQARALREYARGERAAVVNRLLLTAAKVYGQWYESHRRRDLTIEALALADFRLRSVRSRVLNGDAAAIDTIEAQLEVQRRRVSQLEADVDLRNNSAVVAGFLWSASGGEVDLPPGTVPSLDGLESARVDEERVVTWLATAERSHPNLRKAVATIREAQAERLFVAQQLFLPDVEVSYGAIGDRTMGESRLGDSFGSATDAKWGGAARIPLLFLKERGNYSATSAKLEQARFELALVRRDIGIAVRTAANDLAALDSLLVLQRVTVTQARLLRDGEQRKFDNGESTLFLVNARERSALDEQVKLIALEAKYVGARAALAVAIGEPARLPQR